MARTQSGDEISPGTIAFIITQANHVKTLRDTEELLFYADGIYHYHGATKVKELVKEITGLKASSHMAREVIHHVRASTYTDRNKFDTDPYRICLLNGVLDIKTGRLSPHSPDFLTTVQVPVSYNPDADCPRFRKFIREIVRPVDVSVLEEFIGYCLYRRYTFHRWLLLVGEGENGKSTFLSVLCRFLGEVNCSHRTLQDISGGNRFASSSLVGKLANVMPDLPATAIGDSGRLKSLTGEDIVPAEKKGQNAFDFRNFAKIIFSTNRPPSVGDESYAFWRRVVYIEFPNRFAGKSRDPFLFDKLTSERELSGILNLALSGLKRLLEQGDFSYNQTPDQVENVYTRAADPVSAFVEKCCDFDISSFTSTDTLYQAYEDFAEWEGLSKRSRAVFARDLKRICGNRISASRAGGKGNQEYGYQGINPTKVKLPRTVSLRPSDAVDDVPVEAK